MKNLFKKLILFIICILAIVVMYFIRYSVKGNDASIKMQIEKYLNRSNITIVESTNLNKMKYVLFTSSNDGVQLGMCKLEMGLNNLYRIKQIKFWQASGFNNEVIDYKNTRYFMVSGRNFEDNISFLNIVSKDLNLQDNISKKSFFISVFEIPNSNYDLPEIKLLDATYKDITSDITRDNIKLSMYTRSIDYNTDNPIYYFLVVVIFLIILKLIFTDKSVMKISKHSTK